MRRSHSKITDQKKIKSILDQITIGRMATIGSDGYPYITPVNFVYYQDRIYFHCAPKGEKLDNIARDPKVCFEADIPLAYMPMDINQEQLPCNVHQLYHCVIIRGLARVVNETPLKVDALNALMVKHERRDDFLKVSPDMSGYKACAVVEITPESLSAKSDLIQNRTPEAIRPVAEYLVKRGLPGDLAAVGAMGFEAEGDPEQGYKLK